VITSKNRIHRRTVLRGAGGVAIGLPFLSAMLRPGRSHAQEATPKRFVVFYSPGGTLLDKWRPTGAADNFNLQPMMSPLTPYKNRLTFVDGVDMSVTQLGYGHPHSRGMGGVLTGMPLTAGTFNTNQGSAGFADGPSVDQVIAEKLSAGLKFKSLEVSSGWSTGISSGGQPHPGSSITYRAAKTAVPPETDPLVTLKRVFTGVGGDTGAQSQAAWDTAILDSVMADYRRYSSLLGSEDRGKLDAHLQVIAEAQQGINVMPRPTCAAPTGVNEMPGYYKDGFDDSINRGAADGGLQGGITAGVKVPEKGKVMTDILVAALACDLTRVGTMQWSDSEAKFMLPFLKGSDGKALADHHHGYQHDRGFQPGALEIIYNWYASNFAYLLQKMDAIIEGNGMSLLDNSVVLWATEIQEPSNHGQGNMPFVIAGKAGGAFRSGRWLRVTPRQPHNNMLVSILNLFGLPNTRFGHQDHCTGPLTGLL
jgi:hypothetical protein